MTLTFVLLCCRLHDQMDCTYAKGALYEMQLHVEWSKEPQKGFMELFVDNQRARPTILDISKPFAILDEDGLLYMKQNL
jgi:hypothetical protein